MMSYPHWKAQTSKSGSTRSRKLKAIDSALANYHRSGKSAASLARLMAAVDNWKQSKGGGNQWKSNKRNKKIESTSGKGTIETLFDEVDQAYQEAHQPSSRSSRSSSESHYQPLSAVKRTEKSHYQPLPSRPVAEESNYQPLPNISPPPIPPRPLMNLAKIINEKGVDGKFYKVACQTEALSCGPACIRIIIQLVQGKEVGEDYLRSLVETLEEGGGVGSESPRGVIQSKGNHNWALSGVGTWCAYIPRLIAQIRPSINCTVKNHSSALLQSTNRNPSIGFISWHGSGAKHFVVVAGKSTDGTRMVVLDPYYGVQSAPIEGGTLGTYQPTEKGRGVSISASASASAVQSASWIDWVCSIE